MPDRDQFRSLPKGWRQTARALLALGRGESSDVDSEVVNQGFISELATGIPTLVPTLRVFEKFRRQPPLVADLALDELDQATRGVAFDRNDSLLYQQASKQMMQGEYDPTKLVIGFLERHLQHNVIDSKRGVAQTLREYGKAVNPLRLLDAVKPTIVAIARQIIQRPAFKQLRPVAPRARPIDLNANILGGIL